jgi:hypothetical protein
MIKLSTKHLECTKHLEQLNFYDQTRLSTKHLECTKHLE